MSNGRYRHVGGSRGWSKSQRAGDYAPGGGARELEPARRDDGDYLEEYARAGAEDGMHTFDMETHR
jgi:hypothetical protein